MYQKQRGFGLGTVFLKQGEAGECLNQMVKPQGYCLVWLCPVNSEEMASWIPDERRDVIGSWQEWENGGVRTYLMYYWQCLNGWDGLTEENHQF
jgi:hypothetical protein